MAKNINLAEGFKKEMNTAKFAKINLDDTPATPATAAAKEDKKRHLVSVSTADWKRLREYAFTHETTITAVISDLVNKLTN